MSAMRPELGGCVECGAGFGETHWPGCRTGGGAVLRSSPTMGDAAAVCRRRGWAVAFVEGQGWRPCGPDEPGAYVDLDRYVFSLEHQSEVLDGRDALRPARD